MSRNLKLINLYKKYDNKMLSIFNSIKGKPYDETGIEDMITRIGNDMMQTVPALSGLYMTKVKCSAEVKPCRDKGKGYVKYVVVDYVNESDFMHIDFDETNKRIRMTDKKKKGIKFRVIDKTGVHSKYVLRLPNGVRDEVEKIVRRYKDDTINIKQ